MNAETLEAQVVQLASMPTLPGMLKRIATLTESDDATADDVARLIACDPVLSSKLLRLVNSPVYGFPGRISSVSHAVVLLGFNVVKGLVLGTAVFSVLGEEGAGIWRHSLGTAAIGRRLATNASLPDVEETMLACLLHDLGKVVLTYLNPIGYEQIIREAVIRQCHVAVVEQEVYGSGHARVAGWLAREWNFPRRLAEPLECHHEPASARLSPQITAVVHAADALARCMGYGQPGDLSMPPFDRAAATSLGLAPDCIDGILRDAEFEYRAGSDVFDLA